MLDLMRKHAGSWIIKILLGAIALAFALSWGVSSYDDRPAQVAVKVNGESISQEAVRDELTRLTEENRARFGEQFDQISKFLNLEARAREQVLTRVLLAQAAQEMGVVVAPQEIQAVVAAEPGFQDNGAFSLERYRAILARNRLTPEQYESMLGSQLMLQKLQALVAGAAQVTPLELQEALKARLAKVKAAYLLVKPQDLVKDMKVTPEEIEAYYKAHTDRYMEPEKLSFSYMKFPASDYLDEVDVTDDDIADLYEMDRNKYVKQEEVHARHILVKVAEDAPQAEVDKAKAKAGDILKKIKAGADFAALAKENPGDATAAKGGDLGWFGRGQMVPAFEEAAFRLKPGEVEIVRTPFGFHVLKVEEHRPGGVTPLEKVKGELRKKLKEAGAAERAQAAAENAYDAVATGKSAMDVAAGLKKTLENTPLTSMGMPLEGLPGVSGAFPAAQGLNPGQPLPVQVYDGGSAVLILKERVPSAPKPLEAVSADVELVLKEEKAREKAREKAKAIIEELKTKDDPAKALAAMEKANTTGFLVRGDQVKDLPGSREMVELVFLRPGESRVLPEPVAVGADLAVAAALERAEAEAAEMEAKKEDLRLELLTIKRRALVEGFVRDLRSQAEILVPVQKVSDGLGLPGCSKTTSLVWVEEKETPAGK